MKEDLIGIPIIPLTSDHISSDTAKTLSSVVNIKRIQRLLVIIDSE